MNTTVETQVQVTIDSRPLSVPAGTTILQAARLAGIQIPTLCHLGGVCSNASCGVCVVEVEGAKSLLRSCVQAVGPDMKIRTHSQRVMSARKTAVELLLANHPEDCQTCLRNGSCELQDMAKLLGIQQRRFPRTRPVLPADTQGWGVQRDNDKCILCGRCVAVCRELQTVSAIDFIGRGIKTHVGSFMNRALSESVCVSCGQCTLVCPTGALTERDQTEEVFALLQNPEKVVVVQTAPAIRASIGEALGMESGALVTGQMVAALRRLGFSYVFDTQFAADLTIMEEGSELIERLQAVQRGETMPLPMITSCSPGWINFIETFYPNLTGHLSTCKSPQQMFGAVAKTYWAQKMGLDPANIAVVSIMPCTAKKFEAKRPEMRSAWQWWNHQGKTYEPFYDVDAALTTRELTRMIQRIGLDFGRMPSEQFDDPLGRSTGAATIFANTGGVMEAALRTAYELVTGKPLEKLELEALRGFEQIKTTTIALDGTQLKVAVAHTLKNARIILDEIAAGKSPYAFVEIMTCPGGCVGGGGQPLGPSQDHIARRQASIYADDRLLPLRKSHENPEVQALYRDFLEKPLGHLSHELLHTTYRRHSV